MLVILIGGGGVSNNKVLGLFALTMIVIGSMIGAGIFNSPADLGSVANPGAILIGWLITGFGVFALAMVFQFLSYKKPELEGGIYSYAKEQFGEFVGFNSAWDIGGQHYLGILLFLPL